LEIGLEVILIMGFIMIVSKYHDVDILIVMYANVILVNSKCTAVEEHDLEHKPDTTIIL